MTAKYPAGRRHVQASSLTLSLLLALGATPAAATEISAVKAEEAIPATATTATAATD
ncbi:MAG: hypothetical protein H2055_01615, partial [Sphingopyxis sp.]|nr:hypothetical protein [Sphingopyxis sp.]